MNIPLNDLYRHNNQLYPQIKKAIDQVLNSGRFILGSQVKEFEHEFSNYCEIDHCIGVANGTDALELALLALDVQPGDEVVTVANAGFYSTSAIHSIGAIPVYVDVDPITMTMNPRDLAKKITDQTKAIIVTHLYGKMANIIWIKEIALDIPIIEDASQAHGAIYHQKKAGTFAELGCFSFYPTKNLGALGDGGAIITSDPDLATKLYQLRQYGWNPKYNSIIPKGRNSRLDEIQAAILRIKLPHLDQWNQQRMAIAATYSKHFQTLDLVVPYQLGSDYVAHQYVVRSNQRDQLQVFLQKHGISTEIHYPIPDHLQPSNLNPDLYLPITNKIGEQILSIPCFPEMTFDEIQTVIDIITKFYS